MISLSEQLKDLNLTVKSVTSERASIIKEFVEEINNERLAEGYPRMVTGRGIAMKLSHLKGNFELYSFLSSCRDYKNRGGAFGKCFFGSLKVR